MKIEQSDVRIATPDGQMPAVWMTPTQPDRKPAVLLTEAFGLTPHLQNVATRIAQEGYVVLVPDLYYPEQIGVTGFCLGGGLTFLTTCKFSAEITAAAAPFYGMVLDE